MKIRKAKLEGEGLTIVFTERPDGRKPRKSTLEDETPVHPDLVQSFKNMRIHLGILCGYIAAKTVKNIETPKDELIESFHVKGISVKSGDDPGIVISGHRILENGKAVILNTPFTRFEEGEESAYKFVEDLLAKCERAEVEVNAYVDGTKKGEDVQKAIEFPEAPQGNNGVEDIEHEMINENEGAEEVWKDGVRPQ